MFIFFYAKPVYSQFDDIYDEISVLLTVQRIGSIEMAAIIHNEQVYLPVKEVFDFLKIKNNPATDFNKIEGYLIDPKAIYLIDKTKNQIIFYDKVFDLSPQDMVVTDNILYLKSSYFGQIFGLECVFNIRSLSINLNTKLELPAIREMQQEFMRQNRGTLSGEIKADTVLKRKFSLFHLGMLDWSVITTQEKVNSTGIRNTNNKTNINNIRINLGLGAIIAGGETNIYLDYNKTDKIKTQQQFFRWRYANNNSTWLRQIIAGRVNTSAISTILFPVNGIQLTNAPTSYRRSFGNYRISSKTGPGWMVELYVNGILINYLKADASGFFTFEVPIVYGSSIVKFRFYGPWGEEQVQEQNIVTPFSFLPAREFEYNVTAGIVSNANKTLFTRANFNYGLNSRVTAGGGIEYLSSVTSRKPMPFVNASIRAGTQILFSAEYTYGVRAKTTFNFKLPYNLQVDANYIKYKRGQTAIMNNFDDERRIVLSAPIRTKKFVAFSRLSLYQITIPRLKFTTAELLLSGVLAGVSANITTSAIYTTSSSPVLSSNFSATFRLPKGFRMTPQAQYQYNNKEWSMLKCEIDKNISSNGFLNVGYEKNIVAKTNFVTLGIRYNFSFMQAAFSVRQGNNSISTTEAGRGSIFYNENNKKFIFNNLSNVGLGGLIILPYLDINCNGKRDRGEPKVAGLNFTVNGGRVEQNLKDTVIQITGLEAYTNYFIKMDKASFDNVAWKISHPTVSVVVEPNYLKVLEIPVAVMGEASGMIYLNDIAQSKKSKGRVLINFYDHNSNLVGRTISEADGYFSFLGLAPGAYTARIDENQLQNLRMISYPASIPFEIKPDNEGDVVEKLEFDLIPLLK
ncbi:MAG: hypothetical protein IPJ81_09180 [Chitinophagaceae bacterium]|nr:hypothetical protein [Chitinophagaceae bacterium]